MGIWKKCRCCVSVPGGPSRCGLFVQSDSPCARGMLRQRLAAHCSTTSRVSFPLACEKLFKLFQLLKLKIDLHNVIA